MNFFLVLEPSVALQEGYEMRGHHFFLSLSLFLSLILSLSLSLPPSLSLTFPPCARVCVCVCLFSCFMYKAPHLELVSEISSSHVVLWAHVVKGKR